MKILNIVSLQTKGGVEVIYQDLCSALKEHSQFTYVTSTRIHPAVDEQLKMAGVRRCMSNRLGLLRLPRWKWLRNLRFKWLIQREKPDLIVSWNRLHDLPVIPQHIPFIHYEHGTSWYRHQVQEATSILKRADLIITASHAAKRMIELRWLHEASAKVVVNRNALPSSRALPKPRRSSEKIRIGFAGRFHPVKAPDVVVKVARELKGRHVNFEVSFAGGGELLEKTKALTRALELQDQVKFLGHVHDMAEFYSSLDFLICPSIREPFGLVPLEAMAQGCIPLVTRVDGLVESIGPTAPELVLEAMNDEVQANRSVEFVYDPFADQLRPPRSVAPKIIADRILELANRATTEELRERLKQRVKEEFSFSDFVLRQLNHYNNLVTERSAQKPLWSTHGD